MTDAPDPGEETIAEHAVIARYRLTGEGFGGDWAAVRATERALREAVEAAGVGEFDGDEFGGGEVLLFAYGPDADALSEAMAPALRGLPLRPARVRLRYGAATDPDAAERVMDL